MSRDYTSVADLVGDGIVSVGNGIANLGRFLVGSKPGEALDDAIDKVFGKDDPEEVITPEAPKKAPVKRKTRAKPANTTPKKTPIKRKTPVKTEKVVSKQPINDA